MTIPFGPKTHETELVRAIVARLRETEAVTDLVPAKSILDIRVGPEGSPKGDLPCITMGPIASRREPWSCDDGTHIRAVTARVMCWADSAGRREPWLIAAACRDALHDHTPVLEGAFSAAGLTEIAGGDLVDPEAVIGCFLDFTCIITST